MRRRTEQKSNTSEGVVEYLYPSLDVKERRIIRYLRRGFNYTETAKVLKVSKTTFSRYITKIRNKIRKELIKSF